MNDPQTWWLTVTNIAMGVVTLGACLAVTAGVIYAALKSLRAGSRSA